MQFIYFFVKKINHTFSNPRNRKEKQETKRKGEGKKKKTIMLKKLKLFKCKI